MTQAQPKIDELLGGEQQAANDSYFEDKERREFREKLFHLAAFGRNIVYVKNLLRSGKTTFIEHLARVYAAQCWFCRVDAYSEDSAFDVYNELAQAFHIEHLHGSLDNSAIKDKIDSLEDDDEILVIWVDHADFATDELIATLFAICLDDQNQLSTRVHLLFSGRVIPPSLEEAMRELAVPKKNWILLDLPPLNLAQTKAYIEHRLAVIGRPASKHLRNSAIKRIYQQTQGQPEEIDAELDRLAPAHLSATLKQDNRQSYLGIKLIAAALAISLGVSFFLFRDKYSEVTPPLATPEEIPTVSQPKLDEIIPADVTALAPPSAENTPASPEVELSVAIPPAVAPIAEQATITAPSPSGEPTAVAEQTQAEKTIEKTNSATVINNSAWIKKQTPSRWTVQLVAANSESLAKQYILDNEIAQNAAYFKVTRDNKTLYAVIYGSYDNRDDALRNRELIAKKIKNGTPWIRTFASIQRNLPP